MRLCGQEGVERTPGDEGEIFWLDETQRTQERTRSYMTQQTHCVPATMLDTFVDSFIVIV